MDNDSLTTKLIAIVDEAYAYQVGPVGSFICEEALNNWRNRESGSLHYLQLSQYINDLSNELPDDKLRRAFLDTLKKHSEIMSVNTLKSYLEQF